MRSQDGDLLLGDLGQMLFLTDVVGRRVPDEPADGLAWEIDLTVGEVIANLLLGELETSLFVRVRGTDEVAQFEPLVGLDDHAGRRHGDVRLVMLEEPEVVHPAVANQHVLFALGRLWFCRRFRHLDYPCRGGDHVPKGIRTPVNGDSR